MPIVDPAQISSFRSDGYVLIPDALSDRLLDRGREIAASMIQAQAPPAGHAGPYFLWPQFSDAGHPLLRFYRDAGLARLAGAMLLPDLTVCDPASAQLATTIPPWPHRPGGPHVDGLTPPSPDGRPGTFSLLPRATRSGGGTSSPRRSRSSAASRGGP